MTAQRSAARRSTYDQQPCLVVGRADEVTVGALPIAEALRDSRVVVVECYPGVRTADVRAVVDLLDADLVLDTATALLPAPALAALVAPDVTDDPVFGRRSHLSLADLFDPVALSELRAAAAGCDGRVVVVGTGAALVVEGTLVLADLARWEIQQRQRRGEVGSMGADDAGSPASLLYKRAFFVDWRLADAHKATLLDDVDHWLDTTDGSRPLLVGGDAVRRGLAEVARRPFRVVPFFDPAPWGGTWMRDVVDLPGETYGWCFDCVPEENSLLLGFGDERLELPALDLVLHQALPLLGEAVHRRFGAEFPIRFDLLDTMGGGNLSLQVHPLTAYIREHFGWSYTQDESYYLLDAEPGARVFVGLRDDVDPDAFAADLRVAQDGGPAFPAEDHVHSVAARAHDHVLLPAGTVHCSGAGSMVLEVSATPYIFTFKLWDWERLGLDGLPRPINVERGLDNVVWERTATWVDEHLVNCVTPLGGGPGWRAERTGLHEAEFIETHRHWFTAPVPHTTGDGVHVINLVQGEQVTVTSPSAAFPPFDVHYAETFVVPAAVGDFVISPSGPSLGSECATLTAFVRP